MCTGLIEIGPMAGSGKGAQGWFEVRQAQVAYDHPFNALMDDAVLIDFVNPALGPSARVAVEISPESARELIRLLQAALEAGEHAHAH